jgi:hypothetical protein
MGLVFVQGIATARKGLSPCSVDGRKPCCQTILSRMSPDDTSTCGCPTISRARCCA